MYQIILTIISALGAFCAFYLLGSKRQKEKDERTLNEYKAEAETVIRESKQETAEAKAKEQRSETERTILQGTARIIRNPVIRPKTEDPVEPASAEPKTEEPVIESFDYKEAERKAEEAETDDDVFSFLDALRSDSDKRAEELGRRYEN